MVVVLPAPLGPRNPVTVPGRTVKLRPSRAVTAPKRFVSRSTSITTPPPGTRRGTRGPAATPGAVTGATIGAPIGAAAGAVTGVSGPGGTLPKIRYARPPHGIARQMIGAQAHFGR